MSLYKKLREKLFAKRNFRKHIMFPFYHDNKALYWKEDEPVEQHSGNAYFWRDVEELPRNLKKILDLPKKVTYYDGSFKTHPLPKTSSPNMEKQTRQINKDLERIGDNDILGTKAHRVIERIDGNKIPQGYSLDTDSQFPQLLNRIFIEVIGDDYPPEYVQGMEQAFLCLLQMEWFNSFINDREKRKEIATKYRQLLKTIQALRQKQVDEAQAQEEDVDAARDGRSPRDMEHVEEIRRTLSGPSARASTGSHAKVKEYDRIYAEEMLFLPPLSFRGELEFIPYFTLYAELLLQTDTDANLLAHFMCNHQDEIATQHEALTRILKENYPDYTHLPTKHPSFLLFRNATEQRTRRYGAAINPPCRRFSKTRSRTPSRKAVLHMPKASVISCTRSNLQRKQPPVRTRRPYLSKKTRRSRRVASRR